MTPGSLPAKSLGCICCEFANNHGIGINYITDPMRQYTVKESCVIHGVSSWNIPRQTSFGLYDLPNSGPEVTKNQMKQILC